MFSKRTTSQPLEKFSNGDGSAVKKKLGGNFGSGEALESKKRPGTDFKLQEPSRSEIVGIREKNTYENSKKRRVQGKKHRVFLTSKPAAGGKFSGIYTPFELFSFWSSCRYFSRRFSLSRTWRVPGVQVTDLV